MAEQEVKQLHIPKTARFVASWGTQRHGTNRSVLTVDIKSHFYSSVEWQDKLLVFETDKNMYHKVIFLILLRVPEKQFIIIIHWTAVLRFKI